MGNRTYFLRFLAPHSRVGPSEAGSNARMRPPLAAERSSVYRGPGIASSVQGPRAAAVVRRCPWGGVVLSQEPSARLERVALGIGTSHCDGMSESSVPHRGPAEAPPPVISVWRPSRLPICSAVMNSHVALSSRRHTTQQAPRPGRLTSASHQHTRLGPWPPARALMRNLVAMVLACPAAVAPHHRAATPPKGPMPRRGAHGLGNARRRTRRRADVKRCHRGQGCRPSPLATRSATARRHGLHLDPELGRDVA